MKRRILKSPKVIFALGFFFLATGLAVVVLKGIPEYRLARASENWPVTKGLVIESRRVEKTYRVGKKKRRKETRFSPEVVFEYSVKGNLMTSSRISVSSVARSGSGYADEIMRRYPKDASVDVFYDPERPTYAVLQKGVHPATWAILLLPVIFVCTGLLLIKKASFPRSQ